MSEQYVIGLLLERVDKLETKVKELGKTRIHQSICAPLLKK